MTVNKMHFVTMLIFAASVSSLLASEDEGIERRLREIESKFSSLVKEHSSVTRRLDNMEKHNMKLQTIVETLKNDNINLKNLYLKFKSDTFRGCKNKHNKTHRPHVVAGHLDTYHGHVRILNGNSTLDVDKQAEAVPQSVVNHINRNSSQKRILPPVVATSQSVQTPMKVAFYTQMSSDLVDPSDGQRIEFTKVVTNVGDAYKGTSIFICPVSGTYIFSVTILSYPDKYIETDIVRNGSPVTSVLLGNDNYHGTGSHLVVLDLQENDTVWVRVHGANHDNGTLLVGRYCSFSGYILWSNTS